MTLPSTDDGAGKQSRAGDSLLFFARDIPVRDILSTMFCLRKQLGEYHPGGVALKYEEP